MSSDPLDSPNPTKAATPWGLAWTLLDLAIGKVPAVRYALGVAGILAALSLGTSFFSSKRFAFVGAALLIGLMVLLLLFSIASKLGPKFLRSPALFLVWFLLLLFCGCSLMTATSVFLDWPRTVQQVIEMMGTRRPETAVARDVCSGQVLNESQDPIEGATVALAETEPGRTESKLGTAGTDSTGKFNILYDRAGTSSLRLSISRADYIAQVFDLGTNPRCDTYTLPAARR